MTTLEAGVSSCRFFFFLVFAVESVDAAAAAVVLGGCLGGRLGGRSEGVRDTFDIGAQTTRAAGALVTGPRKVSGTLIDVEEGAVFLCFVFSFCFGNG